MYDASHSVNQTFIMHFFRDGRSGVPNAGD